MGSKERATEAFSTVETDLYGLSRWLYENPETAWQEREASRRLSELLANSGFQVDHPAYGLETAFEASVGNGPRVVICAEYDALPGIGHACGHTIIATSSAGAGIALAGLAEELGIKVTVLGTPAEEGGGGKVELINAGAFEGAAASMLVHPSPRDLADPKLLATAGWTLEYFGKEAHAANSPHAGRNALDAFVSAYNNVSTARQAFEPRDRVHGVIREGGLAPNIIPAYSKSDWIIRAESSDRLTALTSRIEACFAAAATATGCEMKITENNHPYFDLVSNPLMVDLYRENAARLGRSVPTSAEVDFDTNASSDMGNVSYVVPSIHPGIGIESEGAVNHQPEFADATVNPSGEAAIRDGALALAHTIIDLAERDLWDQL